MIHGNYAGNVGLGNHAEEEARLKSAEGENLVYLWQLSNVGQVRKMIMAKCPHAEQSHKCVNQCGTRNHCLFVWYYMVADTKCEHANIFICPCFRKPVGHFYRSRYCWGPIYYSSLCSLKYKHTAFTKLAVVDVSHWVSQKYINVRLHF